MSFMKVDVNLATMYFCAQQQMGQIEFLEAFGQNISIPQSLQ